MFELLVAEAIKDDREREIARVALSNLAIELNRAEQPSRWRLGWPWRQRASRASSAAFAAGHSASTIE